MSETEEKFDSINPSDFFKAVDAAENEIKALHENLRITTQQVGFALESMRSAREQLEPIVNDIEHQNELNSFISSAYGTVIAIKNEAQFIGQNLQSPLSEIYGLASSAYSFCSTSGSISFSMYPEIANL